MFQKKGIPSSVVWTSQTRRASSSAAAAALSVASAASAIAASASTSGLASASTSATFSDSSCLKASSIEARPSDVSPFAEALARAAVMVLTPTSAGSSFSFSSSSARKETTGLMPTAGSLTSTAITAPSMASLDISTSSSPTVTRRFFTTTTATMIAPAIATTRRTPSTARMAPTMRPASSAAGAAGAAAAACPALSGGVAITPLSPPAMRSLGSDSTIAVFIESAVTPASGGTVTWNFTTIASSARRRRRRRRRASTAVTERISTSTRRAFAFDMSRATMERTLSRKTTRVRSFTSSNFALLIPRNSMVKTTTMAPCSVGGAVVGTSVTPVLVGALVTGGVVGSRVGVVSPAGAPVGVADALPDTGAIVGGPITGAIVGPTTGACVGAAVSTGAIVGGPIAGARVGTPVAFAVAFVPGAIVGGRTTGARVGTPVAFAVAFVTGAIVGGPITGARVGTPVAFVVAFATGAIVGGRITGARVGTPVEFAVALFAVAFPPFPPPVPPAGATVQPCWRVSATVSADDTAPNVTTASATLGAIVATHVIVRVCPALVADAPFVIVAIVPLPLMRDAPIAWLLPVQPASAWSADQIRIDAVSVIVPVSAGRSVVVESTNATAGGDTAATSVSGVAEIQPSDVGHWEPGGRQLEHWLCHTPTVQSLEVNGHAFGLLCIWLPTQQHARFVTAPVFPSFAHAALAVVEVPLAPTNVNVSPPMPLPTERTRGWAATHAVFMVDHATWLATPDGTPAEASTAAKVTLVIASILHVPADALAKQSSDKRLDRWHTAMQVSPASPTTHFATTPRAASSASNALLIAERAQLCLCLSARGPRPFNCFDVGTACQLGIPS